MLMMSDTFFKTLILSNATKFYGGIMDFSSLKKIKKNLYCLDHAEKNLQIMVFENAVLVLLRLKNIS